MTRWQTVSKVAWGCSLSRATKIDQYRSLDPYVSGVCDVTSRRDRFLNLRSGAPHVLPSLLLCDFGNLESEVRRLEEAGVGALHLDVMDGHFVPNFTYGMPLVAAFRKLTELPLDVHLMIENPLRYIQSFYEAGADAITVHVEATGANSAAALREISRTGAAAGIALNPATPLSMLDSCLPSCDLVLVMSVPAGFGGQTFQDVALEKIRQLRQTQGRDLLLEIDGGVNDQTIERCAAAGAQLCVVGSAIFQRENYADAVDQLNRLAAAE